MKQLHTTKLFYGIYPYKVVIAKHALTNDASWENGWTPFVTKKWLEENNIDSKFYTKINDLPGFKNCLQDKSLQRVYKKPRKVVVQMSVFFKTEDDYNKCIAEYKDNIESVTSPFKAEHVDLLKNNTHIVLRSKLIYGKYRYIIKFIQRSKIPVNDIAEWVNENFKSENDVEVYSSPRYKYRKYGFYHKLYLSNLDDFVLTKLTWMEYFKDVTIIRLLDESEEDVAVL